MIDTSSNILVSVIVAAYNVENYIGNCLEGIINQTYTNIEVIIVNDGSNDNTYEKISQYEDRRIKIFSQQNKGLSAARNYGLSQASGDYILFVDGDDFIDKDLIKSCLARGNNSDMIWFGFDSIDGYGSKLKYGISKEYEYGCKNSQEVLFALSSNKLKNMSWQFLIKRSIIARIDSPVFPVGLFYEDVGSTYKFVSSSKEITFIDGIYYHYVRHSGSVTTNPSYKHYKDLEHIRSEIIKSMNNNTLYKEWNFHIGMMEYQILSVCEQRSYEGSKRARQLVLNNSHLSLNLIDSLKLILLKINLYGFAYRCLRKVRFKN